MAEVRASDPAPSITGLATMDDYLANNLRRIMPMLTPFHRWPDNSMLAVAHSAMVEIAARALTDYDKANPSATSAGQFGGDRGFGAK